MFKHSRIVRSTLLLAAIPVLAFACAEGRTLDEQDESEGLGLGEPASAAELGASPAELRAKVLAERMVGRIEAMPEGRVSGRVIGLDDEPVAGVTVSIDGVETVTDEKGAYTLEGIKNGPHDVTFEHPAYVLTQRPVKVLPGDDSWVLGRIMPRGKAHHVDVEKGGVVQEGALELEFEPRDLVYADGREIEGGEVDVVVTVIDPRKPNHIDAAPAQLEGIDVNDQQVGLFSYGMLEVEMFQGGRKVQVRKGETVRASMNVTGGMPIEAGNSIPMWHHDLDLGIWVQERGTDARVQEIDGELVATAELPHFSAWNYDGPADSACAVLRVPAANRISAFRVVSTNSAGVQDNLWSFTSQCSYDSRRGSVCITNVPAGNYGTYVTVKLQSQQIGSSTWVDLTTTLDSATYSVFSGAQIAAYLAANGMSAGSWCGQGRPAIQAGNYLNTNYELGSFPANLPTNHVRFGMPRAQAQAYSIGASYVSDDSGFQAMESNVASYYSDYDRDGVADRFDNCLARSNADQSDTDGNGIGDLCETWCYVPETDPNASWYDADSDGIDDLCDNDWDGYNPSQYAPL